MRLTKFEHACFAIEKDGKMLIIDPGVFTKDLGAIENVIGVVITHEHQDHFDVNALGGIVSHNPNVVIFADHSITQQLGDTMKTHAVTSGDNVNIGPYDLSFYGGKHALIHSSFPDVINLGVIINGTLCYPGDSLTQPDRKITVLALPVSAPWMKVGDAIDYVTAVQPEFVFPTHDAISSETGKAMVDEMLSPAVTAYGGKYSRIDGTTIDV